MVVPSVVSAVVPVDSPDGEVVWVVSAGAEVPPLLTGWVLGPHPTKVKPNATAVNSGRKRVCFMGATHPFFDLGLDMAEELAADPPTSRCRARQDKAVTMPFRLYCNHQRGQFSLDGISIFIVSFFPCGQLKKFIYHRKNVAFPPFYNKRVSSILVRGCVCTDSLP